MTKGKGPKDWRPGWITSSTAYEVGDRVEVKLYKLEGEVWRSKWFPGEVVDFGTATVDVRIEKGGKTEVWPFPLGDIRPTGRRRKKG